jgi:O-acetyl-ADP-ribose deacetylase
MGGLRIEIVRGDITNQIVDAVVNAANTAMEPGGGVDGAITRAAGAAALEQRRAVARERDLPPLATGDAVATDAGELSARWIIHTAGPVFSGNDHDPELLASCHVRSLEVADELGARSVAFPAISCGIYGYPADLAAPVAVSSVAGADTRVSLVRFVLFDEQTYANFRAAGSPFGVSDEA